MLAGRALRLMAPTRHGAAAGQLLFGRAWQQGPSPAQPRGRPWLTRMEATDAAAQSGDAADVSGPVPVFTQFSIYKKLGAMTIKPMKPKWDTTTGGAWKLDREGGFMLEIANASGTRQYDWSNKIVVSLNPLELAELVTDPDKEEGHNFYHDTFKGQPGKEGSLAKSFKWTRDPRNNGYYVNVYMTDKTAGPEKKTTATCSVTPAEFTVFKQLVLQSMSAMYGFDLAMGSIG